MPRIVEVTLPSKQTSGLLAQLKDITEIVSVRLEKEISVQPPGDVVTISITNNSLPSLLGLLDKMGITGSSGASITTSRPLSVISSSSAQLVRTDSSYTIWEELDQELNKESNMSLPTMAVMAMAGIIATSGLMTNALHLVIGAMVIAPGFEPISRAALGMATRSPSWKSGLSDTAKGYVAIVAGAMLATVVLRFWGYSPANTQGTYLPEGALLSYWTSISLTSVLVSTIAATAGAILILQERSVLTAGVMIALALIPAAAIVGIGIATVNLSLVIAGLLRFSVDVFLVAVMSGAVFLLKFQFIEKRRMPN
jgi:hypothetical protein